VRIVCPSCSAAYEVPDTILVGRRAVRCASCAKEWEPTEAEAAPASAPAPAPEPARVLSLQADLDDALADDTAAPPPPIPRQPPHAAPSAIDRLRLSPVRVRRRAGPALWLAWIVSVAAVLAMIWGAYAWREPIMDAWPPSMRLYAALGLTVLP
jgi:predicted Zn finger-like uncharacterized protein